MKRTFLKIYGKTIVFLLGLFGFTTGCLTVAYGTPEADFVLKGRIKSITTEEPVKNIEVDMNYNTVRSDENGDFTIRINAFPEPQTFDIFIKDIDGEENGSYRDMETSVTFPGTNFNSENSDEWYEGEEKQDITFYLNEKE